MKRLSIACLVFPLLLGLSLSPTLAKATESGQAKIGNNSASIEFDKMTDPGYGVLDPETLEPVDPGEIASTEGPLRIDFAPQLTFATTKISADAIRSSVHAQLFHDGESGKGNFIQVSDYRGVNTGWSLLVRQEHPFRHETEDAAQLKGAVLSFDQAWTNSKQDAIWAPSVSKEIIQMNQVGETYVLAEAAFGQGMGTWSIIFGASEENQNGRQNSLQPVLDSAGNPVLDSEYENQALQTNLAVNLAIPATQDLIAGDYSTVLTWIIAELP